MGRRRARRVVTLYVFESKPASRTRDVLRYFHYFHLSETFSSADAATLCRHAGWREKTFWGSEGERERLVGTHFHEMHLHVCGAETKKNTSGRSCQLVFFFMCQS